VTFRRILWLATGLALGCAPGPRTDIGPAPPIVVVAVTGWGAQNPGLDELPDDVRDGDDLLATGMGATALLEFLDGRPALEQLRQVRDPLAWARDRGWSVRVDVLDTGIRSEPEFVVAVSNWDFADRFPQPADVDLHVIVVSDEALAEGTVRSLLSSNPSERTVVVCGIPEAPRRNRGRGTGGDPDAIYARLRVPVYTNDPALLPDPGSTLGAVLNPLRGTDETVPDRRKAQWWNESGGGLLVEDGARVALGGSGREPRLLSGEGSDELAEELVEEALPRGDLLILLRGSEAADLASFEVLTTAVSNWAPWGLEPIDVVEQTRVNCIQLELVAEPEGDGVLIHDAHEVQITIRMLSALEDEPLVGTPIRDAASGKWLDVDAIRINPWSRNFWRLTRIPGHATSGD
jgi:hypothetical protein